MNKMRFLNGNALKILGVIFMTIDHMGLIFFPTILIFRYIGRLALPIFALMISEGAKYTKNKLKYFLLIFLVGVFCQVINYFFNNKDLYMCILITFSFSVLLIYLCQFNKWLIFNTNKHLLLKIFVPLITIPSVLTITYIITKHLTIDYGFFGILLPVATSFFDFRGFKVNKFLAKLDNYYVRLTMLFIFNMILTLVLKNFQIYSLFAFIILLFYNEKRGKLKMKYFFYLYYPLHLGLLEGIHMLIQMFK